jgi:hypothetical protein
MKRFSKSERTRRTGRGELLLRIFSFQIGVFQEPVLDHFPFEAPLIADFECWQLLIR